MTTVGFKSGSWMYYMNWIPDWQYGLANFSRWLLKVLQQKDPIGPFFPQTAVQN